MLSSSFLRKHAQTDKACLFTERLAKLARRAPSYGSKQGFQWETIVATNILLGGVELSAHPTSSAFVEPRVGVRQVMGGLRVQCFGCGGLYIKAKAKSGPSVGCSSIPNIRLRLRILSMSCLARKIKSMLGHFCIYDGSHFDSVVHSSTGLVNR